MTTTITSWEPGEPLHHPGGVWPRPMFELLWDAFRPDPSPDAARWPEPFIGHDLGETT